MTTSTRVDPRRLLPSVDQALQQAELSPLVDSHGRHAVRQALRDVLAALRARAPGAGAAATPAPPELARAVAARLAEAERPALVRVLNATGVVVHTNLGRAPLAAAAAARAAEVAASYSNLEYDLASGERGEREAHVEGLVCALLDAESALVVNNCAAAVLLAVNTLAEGREVLVSRGELVEIGGMFRIPDVLRKGGARLREVGTTNRTRLADFEAALTPDTALVLKVHPSNFRITGFTEQPRLEELAGLARSARVPLAFDQGSGLLEPLAGALAEEPSAARALAAGADVVSFSGDKLLGGPQAGILAGREACLAPMRRNPLYRALRTDKMTIAALAATLVEHRQGRGLRLPALEMILIPAEELRRRAEAFARALAAAAPGLAPALAASEAAVGGGAAPEHGIESVAIALEPGARGADALALALRRGSPAVVARVAEGRVLVDLRTIRPDEEAPLLAALVAAAR